VTNTIVSDAPLLCQSQVPDRYLTICSIITSTGLWLRQLSSTTPTLSCYDTTTRNHSVVTIPSSLITINGTITSIGKARPDVMIAWPAHIIMSNTNKNSDPNDDQIKRGNGMVLLINWRTLAPFRLWNPHNNEVIALHGNRLPIDGLINAQCYIIDDQWLCMINGQVPLPPYNSIANRYLYIAPITTVSTYQISPSIDGQGAASSASASSSSIAQTPNHHHIRRFGLGEWRRSYQHNIFVPTSSSSSLPVNVRAVGVIVS
jgi:hypothetical protein